MRTKLQKYWSKSFSLSITLQHFSAVLRAFCKQRKWPLMLPWLLLIIWSTGISGVNHNAFFFCMSPFYTDWAEENISKFTLSNTQRLQKGLVSPLKHVQFSQQSLVEHFKTTCFLHPYWRSSRVQTYMTCNQTGPSDDCKAPAQQNYWSWAQKGDPEIICPDFKQNSNKSLNFT